MQCLEFAQGKTLSRRFFDEYSFKQHRRKTSGQWQKCYGEASMSIYLLASHKCRWHYISQNGKIQTEVNNTCIIVYSISNTLNIFE